MKTSGYLSAMIFFSMLIWNTSLYAQDDLYFDPATDEYFAPEEDQYSEDDGYEDEYVDEAFDDGDYYYDDDFFYTRRIRRFNRPYNSSFGYYNPWFTNNAYIDPFYYSSGPSVYVTFGNGFGYNPYGYNPYGYYNPFGGYNPYGYNPYAYNPYLDPCYNPYYSSFYGNYGYYGGNPYYSGNPYFNGNNINNQNTDYTYYPPNFGPRRGTGGTVDANGNGRVNDTKVGRGGTTTSAPEAETVQLNYFENGVSGRGLGDSKNSGREVINIGSDANPTRGSASENSVNASNPDLEANPTRGSATKPSKSTRPTRGSASKNTRPTRTPRSTPRSTTPSRSTPRSTPRSSTPRSSSSSPSRSSSPRSSSSSSSSRSSGSSSSSKSSSRSGRNPR